MRKASEVQAAIQAHHDQSTLQNVPLCFVKLAVLQREFDAAVVKQLEELPAAAISEEQAKFNAIVSHSLGLDEAPAEDASAATDTEV